MKGKEKQITENETNDFKKESKERIIWKKKKENKKKEIYERNKDSQIIDVVKWILTNKKDENKQKTEKKTFKRKVQKASMKSEENNITQ